MSQENNNEDNGVNNTAPKVLIVDDDTGNVSKIKEVLEDNGFGVVVFPPEEIMPVYRMKQDRVVMDFETHVIMERKSPIVVGAGLEYMSTITALTLALHERDVLAEAKLHDKEQQHLTQLNKGNLPFYHNRRRW